MSHADISEMRSFKGIGDAKIAQLRASFEIARRFVSEPKSSSRSIKSPKDAVGLFMPRLRDIKKEIFQVLLLNSKNNIIDIVEIEEGAVDQANPQIRDIALKAIQNFAAGIIAVHNHPSGDPEPSREDVTFTKNLTTACRALEINVLDHIIIGDNKHYSFAEHKQI
jgi:DNA repair protein RadC